MTQLEVAGDNAIAIDWKSYTGDQRQKRKLMVQMQDVVDGRNPWLWEGDDSIRCDSSNTLSPEQTLESLRPIIKFLNDNNIPWISHPIAFTYRGYAGCIYVNVKNVLQLSKCFF